jgi:hypothetical protein
MYTKYMSETRPNPLEWWSKAQSSHRKDRQVQSEQNGFQTDPIGLREKLVSEIKFERDGCGGRV